MSFLKDIMLFFWVFHALVKNICADVKYSV